MLVLASSSPRRQELLANAGIAFMVKSADVPETHRPGETPRAYAERLAREKALAVARLTPGCHVLGADTIVLVDDHILEKPADAADAKRMLRMLSGRAHEVLTAVCLAGPDGGAEISSEITKVLMSEISEKAVEDYVAGGEPMDKAGAYAIQGWASRWIYRIEGDYFTVMGLPVARVYAMLKKAGVV